jgi:hypothetical protein
VPDPYRKLPAAVVEIGTRLRRLADAHTTPVYEYADDAPTTADDATCRPVTVDGETIRVLGIGDFTDQEQEFVADLVRAAKRKYAAEQRPELSDAVTAETKRLMERRTTTLRERAERAEEQRDQLAAAVDRVRKQLDETRTALRRAEGDRDAAEERRDLLAATLHDVLSSFVHKGHPGEPCLQSGWIAEKTVARWRTVLYPPAVKEQDGDAPVQCWHTEPGTPCDRDVCRQPERLAAGDRGTDPATEEQHGSGGT